MRLYMKFRQTDSPSVAAAKTSFSPATAYRFEHDHRLLSDNQQIGGRRRPDPPADFFEAEIVPMLKAAPEPRAVAIFEEMQRRHPALSGGVRRTLERRGDHLSRDRGLGLKGDSLWHGCPPVGARHRLPTLPANRGADRSTFDQTGLRRQRMRRLDNSPPAPRCRNTAARRRLNVYPS
jgi:hypothetical protein